MIRILIVEEQRLSEEGMRLLIDREPDMKVVGEASNAVDALARTRELYPDLLLVDIDMAGVDCFELIRSVRSVRPGIKTVIMSSHCRDDELRRALEEHVLGFTLKEEGFSEIRAAIRETRLGVYHYSRKVQDRMTTGAVAGGKPNLTRLESLTPRERQLLPLLASGMSLKEACRTMNVSYKTADKHKVNLMKKLDIHDRVELTRYAIREKIIEP